MQITEWISNNYIEIFGAVSGILYILLEIRQNIWLWPVGIITSGIYVWIFLTGKLYADMSLQVYYLVISVLGWYWWLRGTGRKHESSGQSPRSTSDTTLGQRETSPSQNESVLNTNETTLSQSQPVLNTSETIPSQSQPVLTGEQETVTVKKNPDRLQVSQLKPGTGIILSLVFIFLYSGMWILLEKLTDSPVPGWDSFITSLSIVATWMLARKIYEHWYLWIVVNISAAALFFTRELYPTVILYIVYCIMSFVGLAEWRRSLKKIPAVLKVSG